MSNTLYSLLALLLFFNTINTSTSPPPRKQSFSIGNFIVILDDMNTTRPKLSVQDVVNNKNLLRSTNIGAAFLQVGDGYIPRDTMIKGGNFWKKPKINNRSNSMIISDLERTHNSVTIKGAITYDTNTQSPQSFQKKSQHVVSVDFAFKLESKSHEKFPDIFSKKSSQYIDWSISLTNNESAIYPQYLSFNFESDPNEEIYGFGLEYTVWNFKGHEFHLVSSEGGVGRGIPILTEELNKVKEGMGGNHYTTYAPSPNFITSQQRGFYIDNPGIAIIDFVDNDAAYLQFWNTTNLQGKVFYGQTPLELTTKLTEFTGRMKAMPDWVGQGAILGVESGSESVKAAYQNVTSWGVPLAGVWIQDWSGLIDVTEGERCIWNWQLSYKHYPDWKDMVSKWELDNVKSLVYINPYFANLTDTSGLRENYFKFQDEKGYFVKNSKNETYLIPSISINFGIVDLTNPDAYNWLVSLIQDNIIKEAGAFGWMHDFGEYLPMDAVLHNGQDPVTYHNEYNHQWAKVGHDSTKNLENRDEFVWFMRAGSGNSPKYTRLQWMGDQCHTLDEFDGLNSALIGLFNSGLTGWGLGHSDIGGYTTVKYNPPIVPDIVRSSIVMKRWIEMSAFSDAIFRSHPGSGPKHNVQVYEDKDLGEFFGKFARIFKKLLPYRKKLFKEVEEYGWPMVRSQMQHYPEDKTARSIKTQFLLGRDLQMAPIFSEVNISRDVYMPADEWDAVFTGSQSQSSIDNCKGKACWILDQKAEFGKPLVFVRKNSPDYKLLMSINEDTEDYQMIKNEYL